METIAQYFLDETGDHTLFDHKGRVACGTPSCSRFFIVGFLYPDTPNDLSRRLVELRWNLIRDPFFRRVASMQPSSKKTYDCFHANADCPEVRREVFRLLREYANLRFLALVKDKFEVARYVRDRSQKDGEYTYTQNELYDLTVKWLLRDQLAKCDQYIVHFARRGNAARTDELRRILRLSQQAYCKRWGKQTDAVVEALPMWPKEHAALQATDYFLWALHRLYEHHDFRYVEYLWDHFRLVIDRDDRRRSDKGMYYNDTSNPLTLEKLAPRLNEKPRI